MGVAGRHARRALKIRPYRAADLDAVLTLWDRCGLLRPYDDPAREVPFIDAAPNAALIVGAEGQRVVGAVMAGHDGLRGWIYRLAVSPDRRGLGFGRALVAEAERWLREHGMWKAQLLIRDDNLAVRDVHVRLGYAAKPRLVMERRLDRPDQPATAGKIDVVVTYLAMTEAPRRPPTPIPPGKLALLHAESPPVSFYRYLYDTVGEPWFWYERRKLADESLAAILQDPRVEIYVLYASGVPAGYSEIDRRAAPDAAIAYFGLVPHFIGRGLGAFLLNWTIDSAWRHRPRRLTVNTCTLDHPKALALYQRAGFVPERQEAIRIDDPRLAGLIPRHLEPRLP